MNELPFVVFVPSLITLCVFLFVGILSFKGIETVDHFFYGKKHLGIFGFACNTFGSNFSFITAVFVLLFWAYSYGFGTYWAIGTAILGFLLYSIPGLCPLNNKLVEKKTTLHDFVSGLSNKSLLLKRVSSSVTIITLMGFLSAEIYIFSNFLSIYVQLSAQMLAVTIFVVLLVYSIFGGFNSVVKTDLLQFIIMSTCIIILLTIIIGGDSLKSIKNYEAGRFSPIPLFFIPMLFIINGLWQFSAMDMWQRSIAIEKINMVKYGNLIGGLLFLCVSTAVILLGVNAKIADSSSNSVVSDPFLLLDKVMRTSNWVAGTLLCFFVSAFLSTADSMLIAGSQALTNDFLQIKGERRNVNTARIILFVLALVALGIAIALSSLHASNIVSFLLMFFSCQIVLLPMIITRIIDPNITIPNYVSIVSIIAGLVFSLIFGVVTLKYEVLQNFTPVGSFFLSSFLFCSLLFYTKQTTVEEK